MYTGLVIEELLALVERAEEHVSRSPRSREAVEEAELLLCLASQVSQDKMLLAGVA